MCQLHDVPLNKYLMELTDDFKSHSGENAVGKIAKWSKWTKTATSCAWNLHPTFGLGSTRLSLALCPKNMLQT